MKGKFRKKQRYIELKPPDDIFISDKFPIKESGTITHNFKMIPNTSGKVGFGEMAPEDMEHVNDMIKSLKENT